MDLSWFQMADVRRKSLDNAVWIPLRSIDKVASSGQAGTLGFEEEFFGAGSIAVPLTHRAEAEALGWDQVGISRESASYVEGDRYVPADVFEDNRAPFVAVPLVLEQRGNREEHRQWHLHQDFVIALGLLREGDTWLAIDEGYVEVARLRRDESGAPARLEARSEHLKDYLSARKMALYVSSYRSRVRIVGPNSDVAWRTASASDVIGLDRWEGRAYEIHEGGMPFGSETAVFHAARTDVAPDDDVPVLGPPGDTNIDSRSWTVKAKGSKLLRVEGEFWRREWVEPAPSSPRVRRDEQAPTVHFSTDTSGTRESTTTLRKSGRWLWFKPEVMMTLAHRRGGSLSWYTRDTGSVRCSPSYDVHFGVNALGLVTVYAKDIALLPEWQQKIWAGYNVSPEGGVAEELLASQVRAEPADTQAPEAYLARAFGLLDDLSQRKLGFRLFRDHESRPSIISHTHRFRAVDAGGLYALAKDVARLTVDSIDTTALQSILPPKKGETWGSLKSLENVLVQTSSKEHARAVMGPLVAAYELRHGDAHLVGGEIHEALVLAGIDQSLPFVHQGTQLLSGCVSALYEISRVLEGRPEPPHQ
jgi:hypothetical protein